MTEDPKELGWEEPDGGNYWLFQANPKTWGNFAAELSSMNIGDSSTWSVAQHKSEIASGDKIFLWQAGKDGGLLGLGRLINDPYASAEDVDHLWVDWELVRLIDPPITLAQLKDDLILRKMAHVKFAQKTNYPVRPEDGNESCKSQASQILEVISWLLTVKMIAPTT
ncbi:MAG: EVE domain-containing protein [Thermomicrobiales bacterium]